MNSDADVIVKRLALCHLVFNEIYRYSVDSEVQQGFEGNVFKADLPEGSDPLSADAVNAGCGEIIQFEASVTNGLKAGN